MKICHFIASKGYGGAERVVIDLVNEMSKEQMVYLLIPFGCEFEQRVNKRVKILHYQHRSRYNPLLYIEIYKILKNENFNLVHTHSSKATEIYYRLKKILKTKQFATKHNDRKGVIFQKIESVSAVSKGVGESIKRNRVKIIYNAVEKRFEIPRKLPKIFTIVAIGRLEKIKGFEELIVNLSKVDFDFKLKIVGEGKEKNNLTLIAKKSGILNKIEFCGFRENIDEIMSNSHLVVVSSVTEGFSLVTVEALLYANMLISTEVGIAKEILPDILIIKDRNIFRKIDDVYKNYDKYRKEFSEISLKLVEKFDIKRVVDEYVKWYKEELKIALLRFSALGDIALSLPTIYSLNEYEPTFITSKMGKELTKDDVKNHIVLSNKNLKGVIELINKIRKEKFDIIFDLQCNDRSHIITSFLNTKIYNNKKITGDKDIFFKIVEQSNLGIMLDVEPKKPNRSYIIFNCGSSQKWLSKRLPLKKWVEFSEILYKRYGLPFYLTGDKSEVEYIEGIASKLVGEVNVLAGKTSLSELKKVANEAFLTVSTDSAMMHISASQKTPTIGIFGATNWIKSAPFGPWSVVLYDKTFYKDGIPPSKNRVEIGNYYENIDLNEGLKKISKYLEGEDENR